MNRSFSNSTKIHDVKEFFEVTKICDVINRNQYKIVGLQVPNHLLGYISDVELEMKVACGETDFFVMADETYGNCCVDIITAKHYIPDLLVHYGNACFNHHNATYPILYSFGYTQPKNFSIENFKNAIKSLDKTHPFLIFYDLSYSSFSKEVANLFGVDDVIAHPVCDSMQLVKPTSQLMSENFSSPFELANSENCDCKCKLTVQCVCHEFKLEQTVIRDGSDQHIRSCSKISQLKLQEIEGNLYHNPKEYMVLCGRKVVKKVLTKSLISNYNILLLTNNHPVDDRLGFNLSITFPHNKFFIFNNESSNATEPFTLVDCMQNVKHLVRRSKYVGQVTDAKTIGLLLYGPAVEGLMTLAQNLKSIATAFGKKCVYVSIGRITIAKLANFLQVDLWVSLSCYNNIYIDNTELYKPVITPIELIHGLIENCADIETIDQLHLPYPNCTPVDINTYLTANKDLLVALSPLYNESTVIPSDCSSPISTTWKGLESHNNVIIGGIVSGQNGIAAQYDNDIMN